MLGKKRRKTKKQRDGKSSLGWVEGPREGRRSGSMGGVRLQKRVNKLQRVQVVVRGRSL